MYSMFVEKQEQELLRNYAHEIKHALKISWSYYTCYPKIVISVTSKTILNIVRSLELSVLLTDLCARAKIQI